MMTQTEAVVKVFSLVFSQYDIYCRTAGGAVEGAAVQPSAAAGAPG